jgi:hypothetical protein
MSETPWFSVSRACESGAHGIDMKVNEVGLRTVEGVAELEYSTAPRHCNLVEVLFTIVVSRFQSLLSGFKYLWTIFDFKSLQ